MGKRRASNKVLSRLEAEELSFQKELSTIAIIDVGIKTDFWQRIEKKQKTKLRYLEAEKDEINKNLIRARESKIRRLCVVNAMIEHIEDFLRVKNYVKAKGNIQKMLEKKRDQIDVYRSRIEGN